MMMLDTLMLMKERAGVLNAFSVDMYVFCFYDHAVAVAVAVLLQNHTKCKTEHDDNK